MIALSATFNGLAINGYYHVPVTSEPSLDAVLLLHNTVVNDSFSMAAAASMLEIARDTLELKNQVLISISYPQENILYGDNLPYVEAAVLWAKYQANTELSALTSLGIPIRRVFLLGHGQGGYLATRINALHEVDGIIASAPDGINLAYKCQLEEQVPVPPRGPWPASIECRLIKDVDGSALINPSAYLQRSLISFTSQYKAESLFIQGLNDPVPNQLYYVQALQQSLSSCTTCKPSTFLYVPGDNNAYYESLSAVTAIRNFINSPVPVESVPVPIFTPPAPQNITVFNDQPLDTWHDIVVSLEYERYNEITTPTGGFAFVFFDSIIDIPRGGGSGYSLGYTPSPRDDYLYCTLNNFSGLRGAFLGVGFDSLGKFAEPTTFVDGTSSTSVNSFAIRDGIQYKEDSDYKLLYNSGQINFLDKNLADFFIDERVDSLSAVKTNRLRVILSKTATLLTVQAQSSTGEFITLHELELPPRKRTAVKVGISNTTLDTTTIFKIKTFNVAGYPGTSTDNLLNDCQQVITLNNYGLNSDQLVMGREFITVPLEDKLLTFTTDTDTYQQKNITYSGAGFVVLGSDKDTVLCKYNNGKAVLIYQYLGEQLKRVYDIPTPDNQPLVSADIDDTTLVMCTTGLSSTAYIYRYNTVVNFTPSYGTWNLYQTLPLDITADSGIGNTVQLQDSNLLIGSTNKQVHAFRKDINNIWTFFQTITSPVGGISKFGSSIQLYGRDLLIGAPYAAYPAYNKDDGTLLLYNNTTGTFSPGQGEVYHYYLYTDINGFEWRPVMALRDFFLIDTPAGNFGTSIAFDGDMCVVGSPGEMWDSNMKDNIEQNPNVGRAYVFKKTKDGLFTQSTILTPPSSIIQPYIAFGQSTGIYKSYVSVYAPFNAFNPRSYITVFDTRCLFELPPVHLPVPVCATMLFDGSGYIIDTVSNTYMTSLCCLIENE